MPSYKNNTSNNHVFSNDLDMEPVIKEIAYSQQKRYMPDVGNIMNVKNVICLCSQLPNIMFHQLANIRKAINLFKEISK